MSESLVGSAKFQSMEEWLTIQIDGDGAGRFVFKGSVTDQPGTGNTLSFSVEFDRTKLSSIIGQVKVILEKFPVIGK